MSWVAILMGSQSDWSAMESATEVLGDLGIEFEVRVSSAHRTPRETAAYVDDADSVERHTKMTHFATRASV